MEQDVERMQSEKKQTKNVELPFGWTYSFRLLGAILDCNWTFHQHFVELMGKAVKETAGAAEGKQHSSGTQMPYSCGHDSCAD